MKLKLAIIGAITSGVGVSVARVSPLFLQGLTLKLAVFNLGVALAFAGLWIIALSLRKRPKR